MNWLGPLFGVIAPRAYRAEVKDGSGRKASEKDVGAGYGGGGSGGGGGGGGFGPGGKSVADMDPKSFGSTVAGMGTNPQGNVKTKGDPDTPEGRVDTRNSLSIDNQRNVTSAYRDFRGYDDSWIDKVGNLIARAFGIQEMDPTDPVAPNPEGENAPSKTGKAAWGIDPIGLALGLGGFANPMIAIAGHLYNGMKSLTGISGPMIALDSGVSRPSSANNTISGPDRQGDVGANRLVGVDDGKRPIGTASQTGAVPDIAQPAPAAVPELLTGVTGRNRNYSSLLSPTPTAEAL